MVGIGLIEQKYIINASQPASDKIFDVSAFEKFLQDKIKVDGRVGNLGDVIQISQAGEGKIEVVAHKEFSGRYLKYLYDSPPTPSCSSIVVIQVMYANCNMAQDKEVPQKATTS